MINKVAAVIHSLLSSHSISHPFITTTGYTSFLLLESGFTIGVSKASPQEVTAWGLTIKIYFKRREGTLFVISSVKD